MPLPIFTKMRHESVKEAVDCNTKCIAHKQDHYPVPAYSTQAGPLSCPCIYSMLPWSCDIKHISYTGFQHGRIQHHLGHGHANLENKLLFNSSTSVIPSTLYAAQEQEHSILQKAPTFYSFTQSG